MARAGQRPGPLDGDTPQAEELGRWLRHLTGQVTLRELAERFDYGRTQWSDFLKGRKIIPSWLLENLVTALVPEPRLHAEMLKAGQALLAAAEAAAQGKTVRTPLPAGTSAAEVYLRLDEARKGQVRAQEALLASQQLVFVLLALITTLQDRCTALESERHRAVPGSEQHTAAERELARTGVVLTKAASQLERARRKREEAEQLRLDARQAEAQELRRLQELRREAPAAEDKPGPPVDSTPALPALGEYDALLEYAGDRLDGLDADMAQAREHIGLEDQPGPSSGPAQGPRVIRGEVVPPPSETVSTWPDVVRGTSADNADNAQQQPAPATTAAPRRDRRSAGPGKRGPLAAAAGVLVVLVGASITLVAYNWAASNGRAMAGHTKPPTASTSASRSTFQSPSPFVAPSDPGAPSGGPGALVAGDVVNTAAVMREPACPASAVQGTLSSQYDYYVHSVPTFTFSVTNHSQTTCRINLGPHSTHFKVYSDGNTTAPTWTSDSCRSGNDWWVELKPSASAGEQFTWPRSSGTDCGTPTSATTAGLGTYNAHILLNGLGDIPTATFELRSGSSQGQGSTSTSQPTASTTAGSTGTTGSTGSTGIIGGTGSSSTPSASPGVIGGVNGGGQNGGNSSPA